MTEDDVEKFRKIAAQLDALYQEMSAASKKSGDKPVSAFKLKLANLILRQAIDVLGDSAPAIDFAEFDVDDLPTASDLNFIVAQFVECAEKVRCENIGRMHNGSWHWKIRGAYSDIVTSPPKGSR